MTELIHGGDLYGTPSTMLDFSANSNPLGMPAAVKAALASSIDSWSNYPDPLCRDLTAAIARDEGVSPEWIHCGNGAADLIFRLALALKPRHALLLAPSFAEYERALDAVGCETSFHILHEKDGFALTDLILKKLSPAFDLLVLCNPNNPTGQPIEHDLLSRILRKCAECKITLLMDECFLPFLETPEEHTQKAQLAAYPNLILLKAFTKLYAMAGLRLGYLLCADPELSTKLTAAGQPWSVSIPAQIAGIAALSENAAYLSATKNLITEERVFLTGEMRKLGLAVMGSAANYIFFKCHNRRDLREKLLQKEILIRSCANYRGLDDRFYRVAVKDHASNERLLSALAGEL